VQNLQNIIADLGSLQKDTQFKKNKNKNRLSRCPNEEDIADLKISWVAKIFLRKFMDGGSPVKFCHFCGEF